VGNFRAALVASSNFPLFTLALLLKMQMKSRDFGIQKRSKTQLMKSLRKPTKMFGVLKLLSQINPNMLVKHCLEIVF
jgi:hypothetical protein